MRLQYQGDIAVLVIDNPSLNALSRAVMEGLAAAIYASEADTSYSALVIS